MQKLLDKFHIIDTIFWIVAFVVLVVGLLLPKTGPYVLVDEIFDVLLWWLVGLYLVGKMLIMRKDGTKAQRIGRIVVGIAGIVLCIWTSRNVVVDMMTGTEEVILHNIQVSRYQGRAGILSVHYYLWGVDGTGNKVRFEISEDDYYQYKYGGTVKVIYYPKTDRVSAIH